MDKEVEDRFVFMEKVIEDQLVRQEKKITELRTEVALLKKDLVALRTNTTG